MFLIYRHMNAIGGKDETVLEVTRSSEEIPQRINETRDIRQNGRVEDVLMYGAKAEMRSSQLSRRQKRLGKRQADDADNGYQALIAKGNFYVSTFSTDNHEQSHYPDHSDLDEFGWKEDAPSATNDAPPEDLQPALAALELSTQGNPHNKWVSVRQSSTFVQDAVKHEATDANYQEIYNVAGGTIFVTHDDIPTNAAGAELPMPALHKWSDIVWLVWENLCRTNGVNVRSLDRFIIYHVDTKSGSQDSIDDILERTTNPKPRGGFWPGTDFSTETDEGKALLGLREAGRAVEFLLTHQSQMAKKKIPTVKLFQTHDESGARFYNLLLEVVNV